MKTKVPALHQAYRRAVKLDDATVAELLVLGEAAAALRNRAIAQCWQWLNNQRAFKRFREAFLEQCIWLHVNQPDLVEMNAPVPDHLTPELEPRIRAEWRSKSGDEAEIRPITAFSLNYWMPELRRSGYMLTEEIAAGDLLVVFERQVLAAVAGSFQSFFALRKRGDKTAQPPREKKWPCPVTLAWPIQPKDASGKSLVVSARKDKPIEVLVSHFLRKLLRHTQIVFLRFHRNDKGHWELQLTGIRPTPQKKPVNHVTAIDIGAGNLALATSNGLQSLIPARRPDKWTRRRVAAIEARQEKCQKGSRGWRELAHSRQILLNRCGRIQLDFQRKLAKELVKRTDAVILGVAPVRLGLAQSEMGTGDQHYGSQNTGYLARLVQLIEFEAATRGVTVIRLEDPKRAGPLHEPRAKLSAAHDLLRQGLVQLSLPMTQEFTEVPFEFAQ